MIIGFDINFNDYEQNILNFYGIWKYPCPCCKAKNSFTRHATYSRNICILNIDRLVATRFRVLRLLCTSCKTTHAILPAGTIPYCFYSFSCILMVLREHLIEETPILEVSEKFTISTQMIYIFILKYIMCMASCISFLRIYLMVSVEYTAQRKYVLIIITNHFTDLAFLKEYFIHTKTIFLMTRRRNNLSNIPFIGM